MPRIISGSARGTRLDVPSGRQTRPTADRVKEALFSILAPRMPAAGFLDLYAGTGQVGLEAASRGAGQVVLVEKSPVNLRVIRSNLAKTHLEQKAELIGMDVSAALPFLSAQSRRFDVIFLDPPYRFALSELARISIWLANLLNPDGIVILEHESREIPPAFVTNLQLLRSCQYGTAMISFYTVDQSTEPGLARFP